MVRTIKIPGHLIDSRTVALDEAVEGVDNQVQVWLSRQSLPDASPPQQPPHSDQATSDVFDFLASLEPGTRDKADIANQVAQSRDWGELDQR